MRSWERSCFGGSYSFDSSDRVTAKTKVMPTVSKPVEIDL